MIVIAPDQTVQPLVERWQAAVINMSPTSKPE